MATIIRPEISERSKYWISKHRHYELKHFCLQYPYWKQAYANISEVGSVSFGDERVSSSNILVDKTATQAMMRAYYSERIKMVEKTAIETDGYLGRYILKAVTEGISFTYLKTVLDIPCSRDMYYDRYRKFFWLLNKARD